MANNFCDCGAGVMRPPECVPEGKLTLNLPNWTACRFQSLFLVLSSDHDADHISVSLASMNLNSVFQAFFNRTRDTSRQSQSRIKGDVFFLQMLSEKTEEET